MLRRFHNATCRRLEEHDFAARPSTAQSGASLSSGDLSDRVSKCPLRVLKGLPSCTNTDEAQLPLSDLEDQPMVVAGRDQSSAPGPLLLSRLTCQYSLRY